MQQNLADHRFGLDRHAWTVLSLLSTMEPDFAEFDEASQMYDVCIQTSVFVKGSNRWIAVALYPQLAPDGLSKVMVVGEDTLTDEIYVEDWHPSHRDHAPSPADPHNFTVHRFRAEELAEAAGFVRTQLASAYRSLRVTRTVVAALEA